MMSGHIQLSIMTMYYTWLTWGLYRALSRQVIQFYNLAFFSSLLYQVTESSSPVTTSDYHDAAISSVNTSTLDQPFMDTPMNTFPAGTDKYAKTGRKVQEQQKEIKVDKSLLQFDVQCYMNSLLNFLIGTWNFPVWRRFEMCYKFSICMQWGFLQQGSTFGEYQSYATCAGKISESSKSIVCWRFSSSWGQLAFN